jgi:hypothetical protein
MIVRFSQQDFGNVSIYMADANTTKTSHVFYNKDSQDVSFHARYRQSKQLDVLHTLIAAPHSTPKFVTPKGALI